MRFFRLTLFALLSVWLLASAVSAADLRVATHVLFYRALDELGQTFARQSGNHVYVTLGSGQSLRTRLAAREPIDLVISPVWDIEALTESGRLTADRVSIARIGVGLSVRDGVPLPDISTAEAFKRTILRADSLVYSSGVAGLYFSIVLKRLDIEDQTSGKIKRFTSVADAFDEVLRRRGNDIAIGLLTQIVAYNEKGLRLVGPLPLDVQSHVEFTAAILKTSRSLDAAMAFMRFLASPNAQETLTALGAN
jgi:molybdate transport system substrate-binding protein